MLTSRREYHLKQTKLAHIITPSHTRLRASTIVKYNTNFATSINEIKIPANICLIPSSNGAHIFNFDCKMSMLLMDVITIMADVSWPLDGHCYDFRHEIENGHGSSLACWLRKMVRTISLDSLSSFVTITSQFISRSVVFFRTVLDH